MISLIRHLQNIMPLPADLVEFLYHKLSIKQVEKRQQVLRLGHVCDYVFFVKSGLVRSYAKPGRREITNWFMEEGDIFTVPFSFYNRLPSDEKLQALEDSVLVCLHFEDLQTIYASYPMFNVVARILSEKYMTVLSQHNYLSRIKPFELRYRYFTTVFPELQTRVSDRDIATYLGMTGSYLSKLKNKME